MVRFLLRYEAQGRHGDIPPTLYTAFRTTLGVSLVVALAVLVFAEPLADLIGLDGPGAASSLRVLAVVLPFATWNSLAMAGTRAFGRMRTTVVVDKIARSAAQPIFVLLVALIGADLLGLTVAWAVPYALAAIISSRVFRRFLARRGTFQQGEPTKSYRELRRSSGSSPGREASPRSRRWPSSAWTSS